MINWNENCKQPADQISVKTPHHVWVVPMSWPGIGYDDVLMVSVVIYSSLHGAPGVLNVVEVSPEIASVDN